MNDIKWLMGLPTPSATGPQYAVISEQGEPIALQIPDEGIARLIAQPPQLNELRWEWATIINRLACIALSPTPSPNALDYAADMQAMVRPYLSGAYLEDHGEEPE